MNRRLTYIVLGIAALATSTAARADILFQNPSDYGGPTGYNAFASQISLGTGNSQVLYSEFSLSSSIPVGGIQWQGAYVNEFASPAPTPTAIGFDFFIYQGDATAPNLGNLLYDNFIGIGNGTSGFVQENFNSNDPNFFLTNGIQTTAAVYDYSVSIPPTTLLPLNTPLWLSIVAITPNDLGSPDWAWNSGGSASGLGTFFNFNGNGLSGPLDRDRTFTITGLRSVPEPASLISCAIGGLTAIGFGLRRRKAKATA
jgi:hypothetical protein